MRAFPERKALAANMGVDEFCISRRPMRKPANVAVMAQTSFANAPSNSGVTVAAGVSHASLLAGCFFHKREWLS